MKGGPLDRTKVVLRHLPPSISKSNLVEQIDSRFAGRYTWFSFCPGKNSQKHVKYSRAYIDFSRPDDVIEFAEFFNGHVFVNEKGTQFKAIVEYAPSQRVPKQWSKKDGREGTILKDPEYLEFLEFIAKPVENLPSAEIQLERKEAERAGAPKNVPIITPLMDYVRQKRASKGRVPRILTSGKAARKFGAVSSRNSLSGSSKRGSEKRASTAMYVLRDSSKAVKGEKVTDTSVDSGIVSGNDALDGEIEGSASAKSEKKILLLKGKQKEIPNISGDSSLGTNTATPPMSSHGNALQKPNQRREDGGRIIKSIILNKDTRQDQQSSVSQSEPRTFASNHIKDKRPPRPPSTQMSLKVGSEASEDKTPGKNSNAIRIEKHERRTRNKDRPDRGVWTPLRRSDGSNASDESLSSSGSQTSQLVDSAEGTRGETKQDVAYSRGVSGEYRPAGKGRGTRYLGSYRQGGRHASTYDAKDADGSVVDGRTSKRGGSGHASHSQERQVWVQKSSSPP